jgi:hypothetical protein
LLANVHDKSKKADLQRLSLLLPLLLILIRNLLIMYAELIECYTDGLLIVIRKVSYWY